MERPPKIAILAAFAALYLLWGSTYLGILFAIQSIPPFLMAGVRFFLAGIIMFAIARFQGAPKPDPATWRDALIVGACLLLFGNGGVTVAEKWVPTGLAALLVATVPIYIALLGWITGTAPRPTPMVWLGLIGGFIGVGLLVRSALTNSSESPREHLALGMAILLFGSLVCRQVRSIHEGPGMRRRLSWPPASKCFAAAPCLFWLASRSESIAVLIHARSPCRRPWRLFILSLSAPWSDFPLTSFSCAIATQRRWRLMPM